uniref:Uncharacterized protein n=1 Tax=Arundo donax TaxID=35708 RepID=A0A0A9C4Q5_ARUDO
MAAAPSDGVRGLEEDQRVWPMRMWRQRPRLGVERWRPRPGGSVMGLRPGGAAVRSASVHGDDDLMAACGDNLLTEVFGSKQR